MSFFRRLFTSPMAILKMTIALCYIGLGAYLYINSQLLAFIDPTYRHVLSWVFMIYGAFRLLRTLTDLPND